jgi:hypothetical protein
MRGRKDRRHPAALVQHQNAARAFAERKDSLAGIDPLEMGRAQDPYAHHRFCFIAHRSLRAETPSWPAMTRWSRSPTDG